MPSRNGGAAASESSTNLSRPAPRARVALDIAKSKVRGMQVRQREEGEFYRGRQVRADAAHHCIPGPERCPEVASDRAIQVVPEAFDQRLVVAEFAAFPGDEVCRSCAARASPGSGFRGRCSAA